ncbi:hypothetical protein Tco_0322757 [Tanacetum coccineum]
MLKEQDKGAGKGISDWVEDQDGEQGHHHQRLKTPIDMLGFFGWLASIKHGMLELVKVVLYRNMGFNESRKYKKTFSGSGVGTALMQVLQGDEFEVEPHDGHTLEGATLSMGTIQYREDNNEAAFVVAAVEKIYAHESLTFNNTVASTVARNAVTTSMAITGSLHQGNSIPTLEGSLSGDCDLEKNGKWSCIYAVGSQEYQMVCTRLDIASADVDQSQAAYMTLTEAVKEAIWLKRLTIESGFELKIVAGIATGALSKAIPSPRFQHRVIESYMYGKAESNCKKEQCMS